MARLKLEDVMITASPGVEGEYDPSKPIDAKEGWFEEESGWNVEKYNPWED